MRIIPFLFTISLTFFFSIVVTSQELGFLRNNYDISFPEKIQQSLGLPLNAGTYTIGNGGDFPTIDSAFNKLSVDGIEGEVIFELTDDLYTAPTEFLGISLNGPIPGAGPNNTVTIKPADNKNVTIQGSGWCVLSFFNTSFLTLDGIDLSGSTTLKITAVYNNQFDSNNAIVFLDNSDHNIIRNITLVSEDNTKVSAAIGFSPFFDFSTSFTADSNLIQHNLIPKAGLGILVQGSDIQNAKGNRIVANIIGDESESLITWGISLDHTENTLVEHNTVQNIEHISYLDFFHDGIHGIRANRTNETVIRNNVIRNINDPFINTYNTHHGSAGIVISGWGNEYGNNNLVYNNLVYDIRHGEDQNMSCAAGINIWYQNNPKIYYNSVYLDNTGSSPSRSVALNIDEACTNVEIKNNIFVNTRKEFGYCASAIYDYSTTNLISDNNDLYYDAYQDNCLVKIKIIGTSQYNSLADWQATGNDLNSINEMPNFVSSDDLHMDSGYLTNIESRATPIAGIDTDFDGDARDSQHPDIGADEFEGQTRIFSQESWTKHDSPVLLPGSAGEWDDDGFISPFVIIDETTYKMWYGASDGTTFRIGYATSPDGINWTKYDDPSTTNPPFAESDPVLNIGPGAWENTWVYAPILYFNGTTYHMWYGGTDGDHDRVGYATSPDGIIWTKNPANPVINLGPSGSWDDTSVDPGPIIFDGTTFQMLYNGYDGIHYQGGYAASNDGINWTKSADPVITFGSAGSWDNPRVQPNSLVYNESTSKYFLFYSGGAVFDWRIGYATAPTLNGPWAKDPSIMLDVTPGGFDNSVVAFPSVIEDPVSNLYKMWYLGASSGSLSAIDYAYAQADPVAVEDEIKLPEKFFLEQNYPNPFNPTTKIQYSIPQSSNVVIKVFNILGREIETLVNEEKSAGTYELNWNAANLPSGVYFYQLKAGSYVETKKMILLK